MTSERFRVTPAVYGILRDGNKVLFARRANTGYMDGRLSLPAGHFDGGETARAVAAREMLEEIGVIIDHDDLNLALVMHRRVDDHERIDFFFEVTKWQNTVTNNEPHKCSELAWFHIDKCPPDVIPEVAFALRQIQNGEVYAEYNFN